MRVPTYLKFLPMESHGVVRLCEGGNQRFRRRGPLDGEASAFNNLKWPGRDID